jgi:hypothetical protein
MNKIKSSLVLFTALAAALLALAAAGRQRVSPHETITAEIDGNHLKLVYGRPYSKDPKTNDVIRKVWGKLVPWGKVWRTGADEATLLTTETSIAFGDVTIPAGTYSLFTLPVEEGTSKLIINKKTGQWGIPYNEQNEAANELARVDMKKETVEKTVDQFTMALEKNPSGGGVIKMVWENTQFSVPFTVKK